jgi:glutathione S-transferase fosA5
MIEGMNHMTLAVTEIERSFIFYSTVIGLKPLVRWNKGAYFLANDFWFCLIEDKQRKTGNDYTHYAFSVTQDKFEALSEKIKASGSKIFKNNASPGDSLYFLDPDDHKLEIHTGSWHSRLLEKKKNPGTWKNIEWF